MRKSRDDHYTSLIRQEIFRQPFLYGVVVTIGYGVDLTSYAITTTLGMNIYLANVLAFCVGATVNVMLLRRYVFSISRFSFGADTALTLMANGLMFIVGLAIFWAMVELLLINHFVAKILGSTITFILNYLTRVYFFSGE